MINDSVLILNVIPIDNDLKAKVSARFDFNVVFSNTVNSFIFQLKSHVDNVKLVIVIGTDEDKTLLIANKASIPPLCKIVFYIDSSIDQTKLKGKNHIVKNFDTFGDESINKEIVDIGGLEKQKNFDVLVIEDEEMNQEIIIEELKTDRVNLRSALSGAEALKEMNFKKPDLILLDFYLPDMNGDVILDIIRSKYNKFELPVLIISSQEDKEVVVKLAKLGVSGYIVKPFDPDILTSKVSKALKMKINY